MTRNELIEWLANWYGQEIANQYNNLLGDDVGPDKIVELDYGLLDQATDAVAERIQKESAATYTGFTSE